MLLRTAIASVLISCIAACGPIGLGTSNPDDPEPTGGNIVSTGSFQGGQVTGSVTIYDMSNGQYFLRLATLKAPEQSGLSYRIMANNSVIKTGSLTRTSGTTNYSFTYGGITPVFQKVSIYTSAEALLGEAHLN